MKTLIVLCLIALPYFASATFLPEGLTRVAKAKDGSCYRWNIQNGENPKQTKITVDCATGEALNASVEALNARVKKKKVSINASVEALNARVKKKKDSKCKKVSDKVSSRLSKDTKEAAHLAKRQRGYLHVNQLDMFVERLERHNNLIQQYYCSNNFKIIKEQAAAYFVYAEGKRTWMENEGEMLGKSRLHETDSSLSLLESRLVDLNPDLKAKLEERKSQAQ